MPNISELIDSYKISNTAPDPQLPLVANFSIRKNSSYLNLIEGLPDFKSDPGNVYLTKEQIISWSLLRDVNFGNLSQLSTCYGTNIVTLFSTLNHDPDYYKRDLIHTTTELISAATAYLSKIKGFNNPKFKVQFLQPTSHGELIKIHRYYQMIWFAGLRRMIGQDLLNIPKDNKTFSPLEIQSQFVKLPGFSWDYIPDYRKFGHTVVGGKTKTVNFCKGTKGDLF